MLFFLACADPEGATRASRPDRADGTDTATEGDPPEATGCEAFGDARARCALANATDWHLATREGTVYDDAGVTLADSGLSAGTDTSGAYNGGDYVYGTVVSDVLEPGVDFDAVVPSWNATTPPGTWITVQLQARVDGTWTTWYRLGVWASGGEDVTRHSFADEADADGTVYTDTLALRAAADAVRIRATLFSVDGVAKPTVSRLAIAVADTARNGTDAGGQAWGVALDVPARSQMEFDEGEAWCSPTSTSMLMAYQGVDVTVPEAADGTWDAVYGGNGNWPFNVAYAASHGLVGEVGWLGAVSDLEPWIAAGVPVAISAAWDDGELDDAPISSTNGHLLVVTGFTDDGDVRVNDPAADHDAEVPRVYDRQQFADAWLGGSGGVAYLIWGE